MLHAVLGDWGAGQDVLETAALVLSELVTNALHVRVPSDRQVGIRIAHTVKDGLLRLEVSDAGEGCPEIQTPGEQDTQGRGLQIVDALTYRWGVSSRAGGIGKTVWAELKAPELTPPPRTAEVAAVTVRAGQAVRVWGQWRTVQSVGTERYATGGLAVVLGLDEGPLLRVPAAEPLAVRTLP
ncbi:ATP-binding protein [Streptomyces filamentosus]|uniref:ATP-binding protein n=1 Tax=Streptomyces filamentosus TaxID=67294 RepID=UPI001F268C72|nr:ATP-binding protein [Streptomyces filamentosus]